MKDSLNRNIIACYISDIVLGTFFQLPIWIVYQSQFLSFEQIAFFAGLALIVEVLTQMPTGAFADIYGRKIALALGNLFMALPMFLIAIFPKPEIMWAYAIMWGLGTSLCMGTNKAILYESLVENGEKEKYPKLLSNSRLIFQITAAVSIVAGGYLYQINPTLPYYISGVFSLLGMATSFIFIEQKTLIEFKFNDFVKKNSLGFLEMFKNSYVTKFTILFVVMSGIASANQKFLTQPYMVELGMGDIQRGWTATIIKVLIAIVGAWLITSKFVSKNKNFILLIPILMVVMLLPAKFVELPAAYLILIGIAFASGNVDLFMSAEINENISSDVRSTTLSAQKMISSFVGASVQWLSAYVIVRESVGNFYTYLGIFSLIVILPLAISVTHHKHKIVKK
ncbi:MFS transporter [Candidatus Dojkabacteria bacterium]|nr:MFS transporter [Candidatus Dojkabacteria bacterium]